MKKVRTEFMGFYFVLHACNLNVASLVRDHGYNAVYGWLRGDDGSVRLLTSWLGGRP